MSNKYPNTMVHNTHTPAYNYGLAAASAGNERNPAIDENFAQYSTRNRPFDARDAERRNADWLNGFDAFVPATFTTRDGQKIAQGSTISLFYATAYREPRLMTGVIGADGLAGKSECTHKGGTIATDGDVDYCEKVVCCWLNAEQMIDSLERTWRNLIANRYESESERGILRERRATFYKIMRETFGVQSAYESVTI